MSSPHRENAPGDEDDEFANTCPICVSPFTAQDLQFRPCTCALRMCVWCWHRILSSAELEPGRCPNCREAFDVDYVLKQKPMVQRSTASRKTHHSKASLGDCVLHDRKLLSVRGIPKQLMEHYAPKSMTPTDVLYQHFLFGQYGRIVAAFACRGGTDGTYNAVLRYASTEAAANALACTNGTTLLGNVLSAALIPTRYCSQFLLNKPCLKKYCWELHEELTDKSAVCKGQSASNLLLLGLVVSCGDNGKGGQTQQNPRAAACRAVENMRRDVLKKLSGDSGASLQSPLTALSPSLGESPLSAQKCLAADSSSSFSSPSPPAASPWPHRLPSSEASSHQRAVRKYLDCNTWMNALKLSTGENKRKGSKKSRLQKQQASLESTKDEIKSFLPPAGFPPSILGYSLPPNAAERRRIATLTQ